MSALLIAQCEYLVNKYIQYLVELFDYHEPYTPLVINNFRTKLKLELDKRIAMIEDKEDLKDKAAPLLELYATIVKVYQLFHRMKHGVVDCEETTAIVYWQLETNALSSNISDFSVRTELLAIQKKYNRKVSLLYMNEFIDQFNEVSLFDTLDKNLHHRPKRLQPLRDRVYDTCSFLEQVKDVLLDCFYDFECRLKQFAKMKFADMTSKDTFPKLISLTIFENSTDQAKQYRKIILTDKIQSALQSSLQVFLDKSGLFKIQAAGKRYLKLEDEEEEEEMEPESIEETKKRKATAEIGQECKRKPPATAKNISTTTHEHGEEEATNTTSTTHPAALAPFTPPPPLHNTNTINKTTTTTNDRDDDAAETLPQHGEEEATNTTSTTHPAALAPFTPPPPLHNTTNTVPKLTLTKATTEKNSRSVLMAYISNKTVEPKPIEVQFYSSSSSSANAIAVDNNHSSSSSSANAIAVDNSNIRTVIKEIRSDEIVNCLFAEKE